MRSLILILMMAFAGSAANAQTLEMNSTIPFEVRLKSLSEEKRGDLAFTVVTATIRNGGSYMRSARIHCEASNEGGNTWNVAGEASNIAPSEVREFRLVGSGNEAPFTGASKVSCSVAAFDASML